MTNGPTRRTVTERKPTVAVGLPSFTLEEAVKFVMKVKRAKNLKPKTLDGYEQNMRYVIEWAEGRYGEIVINEVTTDMLREYILWCAEEKEYYEGHLYKSEYEKGRKGLSPASVNVRIRVLRTVFAVLHEERL